jgi:DNA invertase Pin-like site-specific DNA recombinase
MARTRTPAPSNAAAVVGYIRVSTEEQASEGVSLAAQEATVRAYCTMRGLDLVELVIDAGVSAGTPLASRPGGARVAALADAGRVRGVVACKLDRLFRDAADCLGVTKGWDAAGVAFHLIDLGGQSIDTSTATGRFFLTVMAGAAEMERNLIRERTSAAMAHKKACGEYTGGNAPFGWSVGADGVHLEANPVEQAIIREARELSSAGLSLRKVGAALAERGMLPRSGGPWHAKTVRDLLDSEAAA